MNVHYTTVQNEGDIRQILELQAANHPSAVSEDTLRREGFVTVQHEPEVLRRMNQMYPSVIAKDGDRVAGYCLVMLREFAVGVPLLHPMFEKLESLTWQGQALISSRWFVMGQVCIAEGYRGQGVFDGMYQKLKEHCREDFDFTVTQVAERNPRSLRAHYRVGFETVHIYPDEKAGELWHVIALNLK